MTADEQQQQQQIQKEEDTQRPQRPKKTHLSVKIPEEAPTQVHSIESLEELSPQHVANIWFTQEEIDATIQEAAETVKQMKQGIPLCGDSSDTENAEYTSRGLEYCTPDGFDITTSSLDVVKLILEEQERQRHMGEKDAEMLAAAVGGISRHRLRIAHLAAMKDARAVYGSERLMTTASDTPMRSNSFGGVRRERRGRNVRRAGSFGNLEEKVRRRRGSRGPLGDNALLTREQRRVQSDTGPQTPGTEER